MEWIPGWHIKRRLYYEGVYSITVLVRGGILCGLNGRDLAAKLSQLRLELRITCEGLRIKLTAGHTVGVLFQMKSSHA